MGSIREAVSSRKADVSEPYHCAATAVVHVVHATAATAVLRLFPWLINLPPVVALTSHHLVVSPAC